VNVNEKVYHLMLKKLTTLTVKHFTILELLTLNLFTTCDAEKVYHLTAKMFTTLSLNMGTPEYSTP
jgi:hypothetical protein